jgi:hypothetical protein
MDSSSGVNPSDIVFDESTGSEASLNNDNKGISTDAPESEGTTELPLSDQSDDELGTTTAPCLSNNLETDCNPLSDSTIVFSGQSDGPSNKSAEDTIDLVESSTLPPSE